MSFQAMAWAIKRKTGSTIGKLVLLSLANYADEKGTCFPSQDQLSKDCECSLRAVTSWLKNLEDLGLLSRQHRNRVDGSRTSDLIVLNLDMPEISNTHEVRIGEETNTHEVPDQHARGAYHEPITEPITTSLPRAGEFSSADMLKSRMPEMLDALGITDETKTPGLLSFSEPFRWIEGGCDLDLDVIPELQSIASRGKRITNWAYCTQAIFEAKARREAPPPEVIQFTSRRRPTAAEEVAELVNGRRS